MLILAYSAVRIRSNCNVKKEILNEKREPVSNQSQLWPKKANLVNDAAGGKEPYGSFNIV
jgi:hypothetical protein